MRFKKCVKKVKKTAIQLNCMGIEIEMFYDKHQFKVFINKY